MIHPPLFFYGTLRDADILAATLGSNPSPFGLFQATAPDHATVYFPGQVYPALVVRRGVSAPGLVLEGATDSDRAALDAFEGNEYLRAPLLVIAESGLIEAEAYLPVLDIPATAADWTLEQWTLQHKPKVIAGETETALAIRRRLAAEGLL